jgi:hypothetical protein
MIADRNRAARRWPRPTVNDRVDAAFVDLDEAGVIALQGAGYTRSHGWFEVAQAEAARPNARGAVFYTLQDAEHAMDGHGLTLAFGARGEDPPSDRAVSIAREVVAALARNGVDSEWSGSPRDCIHIPPFEWRRTP